MEIINFSKIKVSVNLMMMAKKMIKKMMVKKMMIKKIIIIVLKKLNTNTTKDVFPEISFPNN